MSTREQRAVFSRLLTAARTTAGMSKADLAAQLGVHRNTISQYERGETAPSGDRCKELETVLGLSDDELARHLGYTVGHVTPEAAIEADPHISAEVKRVLLGALAEARRQG